MTTWTVYNPNSGTVYGRGLSATEAAEIVLSHDGHEFEVRRDSESASHTLFISRGSRNSFAGTGGMTEAYIGGRLAYAAEEDTDKAWHELAERLCRSPWDEGPQIVTDADYDEMMAGAE